MRLPRVIGLVLVLALGAGGCGGIPGPTADAAGTPVAGDGRSPAPTLPPPVPGHELYGYVPYWEMDDGIAAHLRTTPLTTVALFSVTHTSRGAIATGGQGYRRITGDLGRQVVREAHERGARVEVVFSSFGATRNERLFSDEVVRARLVESLVALVGETGMDGLNVDVEGLDPLLVPAYGGFVAALRDALRSRDPGWTLSVATGAGPVGAAMAAAAVEAGADRVFLMAYDYRVASSSPGAVAPLDRADGEERSIRWSLDLYAALGVPPGRLLLGLPLYGMAWPAAGPVLGAPATGRSTPWIPRRDLPLLGDPAVAPERDAVEQVEVYLLPSGASAGASGSADLSWTAVYVDSPATLAPKLGLANERGLAGAGFWAIGYERGLSGYRELMDAFRAASPDE